MTPSPTPTVRTALVTGASRGLGRTLAGFLAARGWRLVVTARGADALHEAARDLERRGAAGVEALPGDVADPHHRAALAKAAGEGLELLVHNASTLGPSPLPRLETLEPDALRAVFETNVVAPLELTRALLPALRARRGWIVSISSDAARGGYEGWGAYGASKAALDLLARTLAQEEPEVTVVAVDPGDLRTQMQQDAFPGEDISDRPTPDITLPFWAWLLAQPPAEVDGRRFRAQADTWRTDVEEASRAGEPTGTLL